MKTEVKKMEVVNMNDGGSEVEILKNGLKKIDSILNTKIIPCEFSQIIKGLNS